MEGISQFFRSLLEKLPDAYLFAIVIAVTAEHSTKLALALTFVAVVWCILPALLDLFVYYCIKSEEFKPRNPPKPDSAELQRKIDAAIAQAQHFPKRERAAYLESTGLFKL